MTERKRVTLEFFSQLKEPERSQAIENFDEGTSNKTPSCLANAVFFCINWTDSPQGWDYWDKIHESIRDNTYHTKPFDIEDICESVENENDFNCSWTEIHKIVKATYEKLKYLGKIKE
jgi:hypothetical protein